MVEIQGRFKRTESIFNVAAARVHPPCDNSSGSDHSPEDMFDLSDLVASFIEREGIKILPEGEEMDSYSDDNDLEDVRDRLRKLQESLSDGEERMRIMAATTEVAGKFVGDINSHKRLLMNFLRNKGFEAGLCKSRWERFGRNTAEKYEYVDVRCSGDRKRYIVETNLAEEFEIARPTKRYLSILSQVPRVFVGTSEELKQLVRIMCYEMRRSMKNVGIHVPPWRRNSYMQAKWFGFYKRTWTTANYEVVNTNDTTMFKGCKEELWEAKGLEVMVGQLSVAFNASHEVNV